MQASPDGLQAKPESILGKLSAGGRDLRVGVALRGLTNPCQRDRSTARFAGVEECCPCALSLNLAELVG
jgi:hypothetical protein